MRRLVAAEVEKLRTIWSSYLLLGLTLLATGLIGLTIALAPHPRHSLEAVVFPPRGSAAWFLAVFSAMAVAQDLALVLGILVVTGEFRHKTATPIFLAEPRRARVAGAKLMVSAGGGVLVAASAALAALVLGLCLVAAGYGDTGLMLGRLGHVLPGIFGASVLFAMYGLGLGALLKNQVVALVVGLGVSAVVEPIVVGVWPGVGRWLPNQAAQAIEATGSLAHQGLGAALVHPLSIWQAVLVLLGYALVLATAGSYTTLRADIT